MLAFFGCSFRLKLLIHCSSSFSRPLEVLYFTEVGGTFAIEGFYLACHLCRAAGYLPEKPVVTLQPNFPENEFW
jgi:hypothetical protein